MYSSSKKTRIQTTLFINNLTYFQIQLWQNEFFSGNTRIRKYVIFYIKTTSRYDAKALFSNTRELIRINIEHCSVKTERKRRRKMHVM